MGWVKVDDGFFRHPKSIRAGRDARLLFLAGVCYCGSGLTDGYIPEGALAMLAAETGITKVKHAAEALVKNCLWERIEGGYMVHDYLDYNTHSGKVNAERDAARERMRRMRSENVRPNKSEQTEHVRKSSENVRVPETEEKQNRTETEVSGINPERPAPPKAVKQARRAHQFPDDWRPGGGVIRVAQELAMDESTMHAELAKFASHFRANGKTMIDWDQSAMNWLRRTLEFPAARNTFIPKPAQPKGPDFAARAIERRRLEQTGS